MKQDIKNHKLYVLKKNLEEEGFFRTVTKKIIPYLFRPFGELFNKNRSLMEFRYGIVPSALKVFSSPPDLLKVNQSELVKKTRGFWYGNIPGLLDVEGEKISRKDIFLHGGPNPDFTCPVCQKAEWLSRIRGKNLFIDHECKEKEKCRRLCALQENDLWTHLHQNFNFAIGSDPSLPSPKGIYVMFGGKESFLNPKCVHRELVFRRQLAYAAQVEAADSPFGIDWKKYDFAFIFFNDCNVKFPRPDIPVVLYAHDMWPERKEMYQWTIDWLKPDVLLTPYPTQWRESFRLSPNTKVVFTPYLASRFFTRPNLGKKDVDLLVIGATANPIYSPRKLLSEQISRLGCNYKIEFSHEAGSAFKNWEGPLYKEDASGGGEIRLLNKWSEYLGSAKYATFGRIKEKTHQFLLGKYYEILGSGAVPIFPEVPDLKILGVKAFKHYIPLSEIEGDNERLRYILGHYDEFSRIAKNAVEWYENNSDKLLFDDFETLIGEITKNKFPKRSI